MSTEIHQPRNLRLSLVMCTRDRAARLPRTLAALEQLETGVEFELVIVDNGSVDATAQVLREFQRRSKHSVRVLTEPRPGLCTARNRGWRSCRADIVGFVDDDCYPAHDFVTSLDRSFADPNVGYVGGKVTLFDQADLPLTIQLHDELIEMLPGTFVRAGLIHGANMAFRTSVLESLNGFDECLGAGTPTRSGGDADAIARATILGHRGRYDPLVVVAHHHRRRTELERDHLAQGYSIGRGAFHVKGLLNLKTRPVFFKPVLYHVVSQYRRRRFVTLLQELRGALTYVCLRALRAVQHRRT